jgi:hypothetical protein
MALPLNQISTMPQLSSAFLGWKSKLSFKVITQTVLESGFIESSEVLKSIMGVWQPMVAEQIALKPEGQRSWSWFMLHIEGINRVFQTNDRVVFRGELYKAMAIKDYTLNNYTQVDLILDYQDE